MCFRSVFVLFYFVFEGNFQVQVPGGLYLEGQFIDVFFYVASLGGLYFGGGLAFGGAYIPTRSYLPTMVKRAYEFNDQELMLWQRFIL